MALIKLDSGPRTGETILLDKPKTTFGRHATCDCLLVHPTVSREHFYVERNGGKFFLVDQESGNGTFANGARVSWVELKDGDTIQAGPFTMTFQGAAGREESASPAGESERAAREKIDREPRAFDETHERIYPREYLDGIEHFNARRYFDAHEVWEEIWLRSSGDTKLFYQMLIQAAVGLLHYERGNLRGSRGMYKNVIEKLQLLPRLFMSIDLADFAGQFKSFFAGLMEQDDESTPPAHKPGPRILLLSDDDD